MPTSNVLRIGREPDNDFVVNLATVSGYHARVTWSGDRPGEAIIEDIGSTNGTAVNAPDRRATRASFTPADTIYLGTYAMPASQLFEAIANLRPVPGAAAARDELTVGRTPVVVGRDPGCDRVVASPVVSGRHARITRRDDGTFTIEDLGSANGTYVNGRRIDQIGAVRPGDTIALGSHALVLAVDPALVSALANPATAPITRTAPRSAPPPAPDVAPLAGPSFGSDLAGAWRAAWSPAWKPAAYLVLGPVLGLLVVLTSGFDPTLLTGPGGPGVGGPALVAPLVSRLGSLTVMLGLIGGAALMPHASAVAGPRNWLARSSALAALCVAACLLAWVPALGMGLGELGVPSSLGFLMLGAGAGFGLGLFISAIVPRPAVAWAIAAVLLVPIWMLGGEGKVWASLPGAAKTVAAINPARWTFEGLMVNASDRIPASNDATIKAPPSDLAEPYFPAETDRIGPLGATIALAAMMIGWATAAAFIAASARPRELAPPPA